jgi:thiamine monophosphate synthase
MTVVVNTNKTYTVQNVVNEISSALRNGADLTYIEAVDEAVKHHQMTVEDAKKICSRFNVLPEEIGIFE